MGKAIKKFNTDFLNLCCSPYFGGHPVTPRRSHAPARHCSHQVSRLVNSNPTQPHSARAGPVQIVKSFEGKWLGNDKGKLYGLSLIHI